MTLRTLDVDPELKERIIELDPKERRITRGGENTTTGTVRPGDLVQFHYTKLNGGDGRYKGLAVSTKRSGTSRAIRPTLKGDRVLQVVVLDSLNDEAFKFVLNKFYKNRVLSEYVSLQERKKFLKKLTATQRDYYERYTNNLDRDQEERSESLENELNELSISGQAALNAVIDTGEFKYFRIEDSRIKDFISISLLDKET